MQEHHCQLFLKNWTYIIVTLWYISQITGGSETRGVASRFGEGSVTSTSAADSMWRSSGACNSGDEQEQLYIYIYTWSNHLVCMHEDWKRRKHLIEKILQGFLVLRVRCRIWGHLPYNMHGPHMHPKTYSHASYQKHILISAPPYPVESGDLDMGLVPQLHPHGPTKGLITHPQQKPGHKFSVIMVLIKPHLQFATKSHQKNHRQCSPRTQLQDHVRNHVAQPEKAPSCFN